MIDRWFIDLRNWADRHSGAARVLQRPMSPDGVALYLLGAVTAESLVTIVHHVYGGLRYPGVNFRFYVVFPVALALGALWVLVLLQRVRPNRIVLGAIAVLVLIVFVAWLGLFEGLYNHIVKDVLYASGLTPTQLHHFFRMYEAPADSLFEATGGLTFVAALFVVHAQRRFVSTFMRILAVAKTSSKLSS